MSVLYGDLSEADKLHRFLANIESVPDQGRSRSTHG